jgi:hypothetical protein
MRGAALEQILGLEMAAAAPGAGDGVQHQRLIGGI